MAITGNKRTLTISVTRKIGTTIVTGYPKTYDGKQAFNNASVDYPLITADDLATMPYDNFIIRLEAHKQYVQDRKSVV